MNNQNNMTQYLSSFIEGMLASGVQQVVISPGSRSTPLALLLHRHEKVTTFIEVDERSAAFFALGLSKASQRPVALLCTSGTAAANYYPAICEANASAISLVILTTDRPHELRQVGAPQAMDQLKLFQDHVKAFIEMALPEATQSMLDYAYWQGERMTDLAKQSPKGPVHLNFPLREPLLPNLETTFEHKKVTKIMAGKQLLSEKQIKEIVLKWQGKRGVFVAGGAHTSAEGARIVALANQLNWPIIGDPLTNLTGSDTECQVIMSHADFFINEVEMAVSPEVIVRLGSLPISKNTMLWLQKYTDTDTAIYFVDETGQWQDSLKQGQYLIQADQLAFTEAIMSNVTEKMDALWIKQWIEWQEDVEDILLHVEEMDCLNETTASLLVHKNMIDEGQLFVSNSNAIRFLDRFADKNHAKYQLFGNRGINGIDGIVSTALGMTASQPDKQNILLIGDLALYHDMNGLLLAKQYQLPLTIVLLNNNGGGIFSYLAQNKLAESDFESLFGTPIDLDFKLVAQLYGAIYTKAESLEQLNERLEKTQQQPIFQLIEVTGERQENVLLHEKIVKEIKKRLGEK